MSRRPKSRKTGRPAHLSHSQISRYLQCPEQYRLYYIERLRPRYAPASLVFGQTVHQALAHLFQHGLDPAEYFLEAWAKLEKKKLNYGKRDSWQRLNDVGQALLTKFADEELGRLSTIESSERSFRLNITTLDLPFIGIIDLVAKLNGKRTVVDFKTSASSYAEHEVELSDQLTAYQLAEPEAEQNALCVLVKTKQPKIEWYVTSRTADQLAEYLRKVHLVTRQIDAGEFYKRPGMWCAWCDFLPVCLGDEKRIRETLVQP